MISLVEYLLRIHGNVGGLDVFEKLRDVGSRSQPREYQLSNVFRHKGEVIEQLFENADLFLQVFIRTLKFILFLVPRLGRYRVLILMLNRR